MLNLNRVELIGNMTRDPEVRSFGDSKKAQFGLAVNRRVKDKDTGDYKDEASFVDVVAWGRTAESIEKSGRKGLRVYVCGQLRQENWNDKQSGQKRSKLVVFLAGFDYNEFQTYERQQGGGQSSGNGGSPPQARESSPDKGYDDDSSIPF